MKILMLSAPGSTHTIKWVRSLADQGLKIAVFGLSDCDPSVYSSHPSIELHTLSFNRSLVRSGLGSPAKLSYLRAVSKVKQIIAEFKPDIVHAHFATSYGLLGALSGFHPYVLSVWGSDVYDFPHKSILHRALLRFNLRRADKVLSTSHMMAAETRKYTSKTISVTPFGIDLTLFSPKPVKSLFDDSQIVIGTIKALENVYGIDTLIRAFELLKKKYPALPLKLMLVGSGSQEQYLKDLADTLNLAQDTIFTGQISYDRVVDYHNMLSIFVSLSNRESFGVAVVEASACEKPVVVSNVGGLPEVVENGVTGFVVRANNPEQAAAAIEKLILDPELCLKMGQTGRNRVSKLYNWPDNVNQMTNIYAVLLKKRTLYKPEFGIKI
jgi:glycosyltransferase involved in cell wall biosynthesis